MLVIVPTSPKWMEEDRSIVYTTNSGLVCVEKKDYPKLNCDLIKEAIGPKFVEKEEFEIKDED